METAPRPIRILSRAETKLKQKFTFCLYIFEVEHKICVCSSGGAVLKFCNFRYTRWSEKYYFFNKEMQKLEKFQTNLSDYSGG